MLKYLKSYVTDFEKALNIDLLHKTADEPLVEFIKDSFRSLEVFNNIKILGFDYNDTESEIDDDKYVLKRDKKKKNLFKNKYINDNRCGLLTVHIQITVDEVDSKTKRVQTIKKIKHKNLLIPICLNGRYRIKGTDYYSIIQLTDKSTYNTSDTVTLKTLMPVAIKRESLTVKSVDDPNDNDDRGMEFTVPVYNVYIFKNPYPVILFFFARGYVWAMNYLQVNSIVNITDTLENADFEKNLYFQISSKCYVYVNKYIFINNTYIQGIIGMILKSTTNRFSVEDFYNEDTWYKKLGSQGKIEKGKGLLTSLKRLLDERSKKNLKLDKHDKEDIYAILRWQMMEYNTLRLKDNMSLDNKRFRENEQYAALFDLELSKRLKRILQLGSKAVMSNFEELFKFSNELLIQIMQTSGILVYDDNINDMDFFSRYKYSTKGPHSLKKHLNLLTLRTFSWVLKKVHV